MKHKKFSDKCVVKLEKGDEVIACLTNFAKDEQIKLAKFFGIGAVSSITVGFYQLPKKTYVWREFIEELEVTSLLGNIAILDSEPFIHAHINVSDKNFNVYGGHLKKAIVGATLEVVVELIDGEVERKFSDEIGLNLLNLPS